MYWKIAEGDVVPLSEIGDKAFASGALGKVLESYQLKQSRSSPVEGTVTVAFNQTMRMALNEKWC